MNNSNLTQNNEKIKNLETQLSVGELKEILEKSLKAKKRNELKLKLDKTDKEDLLTGVRKNKRKYSVRTHRDRYFYPGEWMKFYDALLPQQKLTFDILIQTGARINEAQHIKKEDIDFIRNTILLRVTKVKAKKGEKYPRPRPIPISSQFTKRLKKSMKELNNNEYIKMLSKSATHIALKKTLQKIKIKDWYMFSIHNIRKTHGNWLKALGIKGDEISKRLGHDHNTFLESYVSSDIFNYKDKQDMRLILGDLYQQ